MDHSLLFHIHFNELSTWYNNMETKYGQKIISDDLNECETAKEIWVQENDATATVGLQKLVVKPLSFRPLPLRWEKEMN